MSAGMTSSRLFVLLLACSLSGLGTGCSCSAPADPPKTADVHLQNADLEKSIQDQEARIKALREENEELRKQLKSTSQPTTPAPSKP
jgi:septal ring factor EnvC (AmiA/AmiB activator)